MKSPALSLILCSRNDSYMGNSVWRLQTTLNYAAEYAHQLGRQADVEIVVADWGSAVPLRDVVKLGSRAAGMTSFVTIPQNVAEELQHDSPFAEVIALNVAARRARGLYIGRIDQDTLVGTRFFQTFFDLYEGRRALGAPMHSAPFFANVRMVPYRFAVRCPDLPTVDLFVRWLGPRLPPENARSTQAFYRAGVGIWLLHRGLWNECGGYDERMIYMNSMEVNMIQRLQMKYEVVDLGRMTGPEFFHLEHYHPRVARKSSTYRKVNPHLPFWDPETMNPNGAAWGLAGRDFPVLSASSSRSAAALSDPRLPQTVISLYTIGSACLQVCGDAAAVHVRAAGRKWSRRGSIVWNALRGERITAWPTTLRHLIEKRDRSTS